MNRKRGRIDGKQADREEGKAGRIDMIDMI
jgi:hypothetical protein